MAVTVIGKKMQNNILQTQITQSFFLAIIRSNYSSAQTEYAVIGKEEVFKKII